MYTKRTYIVPQLNLKDGILLHIHGGVEGVEDVSPLSSALELYEVTDLDGGNCPACCGPHRYGSTSGATGFMVRKLLARYAD